MVDKWSGIRFCKTKLIPTPFVLVAQLESGQQDFSQSVVHYRKEFLLSGKQFQPNLEVSGGN